MRQADESGGVYPTVISRRISRELWMGDRELPLCNGVYVTSLRVLE